MKKADWQSITIKELAILVSTTLKKNGVDAVLVGGACVSIYTENIYESGNLDYITYASGKELKDILKGIGFYQKKGKHFEHALCPFVIEFPSPPVALGNQVPVTKFNHIRALTLLTPTDCVKDRLAAYYHWHDPQSLDQALLVARSQKINLKEIATWSKSEGATEHYIRFRALLKK